MSVLPQFERTPAGKVALVTKGEVRRDEVFWC